MTLADLGIVVGIAGAGAGALIGIVNRQIASYTLQLNREITSFGERIGNHEARIRFLETQATENGAKLDYLVKQCDEIHATLKEKVNRTK